MAGRANLDYSQPLVPVAVCYYSRFSRGFKLANERRNGREGLTRVISDALAPYLRGAAKAQRLGVPGLGKPDQHASKRFWHEAHSKQRCPLPMGLAMS